MILKSRSALADIANAKELKTAVEVGTHQAVFAAEFMDRFRGHLTMIDPWEGYDGIRDVFYPMTQETNNRDDDFEIARMAMMAFPDRHEFLRMRSDEAISLFDDFSVGIVYIDALHEYESVIQDLNRWEMKVVKNGILSGHDFSIDNHGVIHAVLEFCRKRSLQFYVTHEDVPSWWIEL